MKLKLLALIVVMGLILPSFSLAQSNFCIFEVSPTSGDETTTFEFTATTCSPTYPIDPEQTPTYRLVVSGPNNAQAVFCMEGNEDWEATLSLPGSGFTESGNYTAELQWRGYGQSCNQTSNPPGDFLDSVSFSVDVLTGALACGTNISIAPDPTAPDPCVPQCPIVERTNAAGTKIGGWFCGCGTLTSPACCPEGNPGGYSACLSPLTACVAGQCRTTNLKDTSTQVAGENCSIGTVGSAIGCIPFEDINATTSFFLRWALGVGGGIALFLIAISAVKIMTTRGDPKRIQDARDTLTAAIAGLVLIILSLYLVRFMTETLLQLF